LSALAGMARRARRPLEKGLLQQLLTAERAEVEERFAHTKAEMERLFGRFDLERGHAR
jgi:hypothetical protein